MISIKSNHAPAEIKKLEALAAKLSENVGRLSPGATRNELLAETSFNVRIDALKASKIGLSAFRTIGHSRR